MFKCFSCNTLKHLQFSVQQFWLKVAVHLQLFQIIGVVISKIVILKYRWCDLQSLISECQWLRMIWRERKAKKLTRPRKWRKSKYTGGIWITNQGNLIFEKLEKNGLETKGRHLYKFRRMLFTTMKTNCCVSQSCLPFGLQNCFQAIWFFPLYKISLNQHA